MTVYLSSLLAHHLNFDLQLIENELPYPLVLQYLHSIMLINGNNTRWLHEDKTQTETDKRFIQSLDL